MTWLEQLVREFYEVQGYWVRTNVRFEPTGHGGYAGEADILAWDSESSVLLHVETTLATTAWSDRSKRIEKQFTKAAQHYEEMFPLPRGRIIRVEKVAILRISRNSKGMKQGIPGAKLVPLGEFMCQVADLVTARFRGNRSPPEQYPLLRTIYFLKKAEREAVSGTGGERR